MRKYQIIVAALLITLGSIGFALAAPQSIYQVTILPVSDNNYDLGTTTLRWRNLYVQTASTTNLTISGVNGSSQCLHTNATGVVSGTGSDCGAGAVTSVSGTFPIISSGGVTPTISFGGLSTSTAAVIGNIPYFSGANTFANVATSSATCTGSAACSAFTVVGSVSPAINVANTLANGLTATTTFYNGGVLFSDGSKLTQAAAPASLFWDNTNLRLGIGTIGPSSALQVVGSSTATTLSLGTTASLLDPTMGSHQGTVILNDTVNNDFGIGISAIRNSAYDIWMQTGAANGGGYRWYIGTNEKMTMDKNGNVGIATTTPSAKFDVNGTARVLSNNALTTGSGLEMSYVPGGSAYGTIYTYNRDTSAYIDTILGSGGNQLVLKSGGNVGIGTTTPGRLLDIGGSTSGILGARITNTSAVANDFSALDLTQDSGSTKMLRMAYLNSSYTPAGAAFPNSGLIFTGSAATNGLVLDTVAAAPILFFTNSTEAVRITSTGNVGIGTTSPLSKLDILGGSGQTTTAITDAGDRTAFLSLNANNSVAGSGAGIIFGNNQSQSVGSLGTAAIKAYLTNGAGNTVGDLAFMTRNATSDTALTERMRINSAGQVGINNGGVYATSLSGSNPFFQVNEGTAVAMTVVRSTNDANAANIVFQKTRGANGTTLTTVQNGDALGQLAWGGADGTNWQFTSQIKAVVNGTVAAGSVPTDLTFYTGSSGSGSERIRITSGGNVGIGTTSPNVRLNVADTGNTYPLMVVGNGQPNGVAVGTNSLGNPVISGYNAGFTATQNLILEPSGSNVGVGTTTPLARLDVYTIGAQDAIAATGNDPSNARVTVNNINGSKFGMLSGITSVSNTGFSIRDLTNSADRIAILGNGKVGVNTTAPQSQFDVNGSMSLGIYGGVNAAPANGLIVSGNVGIGTTTPQGLINPTNSPVLNIGYATQGGIVISKNSGQSFELTGNGAGAYIDVAGAPTASNNFLAFRTNNTASAYTPPVEQMRITSTGNVGIGSTTPNYLLSVGNDPVAGTQLGTTTALKSAYTQIRNFVATTTVNGSKTFIWTTEAGGPTFTTPPSVVVSPDFAPAATTMLTCTPSSRTTTSVLISCQLVSGSGVGETTAVDAVNRVVNVHITGY